MSVNAMIYKNPEPTVVARMAATCGFENACERWHWLTPYTVQKLITLGNAARVGRPAARRTTVEQEDRIIAEAQRLGSYSVAAVIHNVSQDFMRRLFIERGLPLPRMTYAQRMVSRRQKAKFRELVRLYAIYVRGLD